MHFIKSSVLALGLALSCSASMAQKYKTRTGPDLSKEEMRHILLDKSKKQKTAAFVALASGPILTGVGIYLIKHSPDRVVVGPNYLYVEENKNGKIGAVIAATGILTTLSSIPLFISSGKAKREARLVFSDQSTTILNRRMSVPSLGWQISFL